MTRRECEEELRELAKKRGYEVKRLELETPKRGTAPAPEDRSDHWHEWKRVGMDESFGGSR